ncbi:hypothetical protein WA577_003805, partial [Blastocystis sp. JDR]
MSEHSDSEVDEIDPSEKWTPEEREQYFNEMEECPLLMKDYTEEDMRTNTSFQALRSIANDKRTDEEMVEDFQHEAKKSFAIGACMYKKAYREFKSAAMYAERLPKTPENQHLLATLYANCGLIQMKRENYRTCITDCDKALAIEPRYKKVLYRKARALAGLNHYDQALVCCKTILEDEPDNIYTLKLKTECEEKIHRQEKRNQEIARNEQKKEEEKQKVNELIVSRGYQMGPSLYEYPERFNAPIHVRNEELIFPVMILYPESSQSDYVREMSEEDTFADLFNMLYPSRDNHLSPMEWDEEKCYTADNVEIWFQELYVLPYPKEGAADISSLRHHFKPQKWVRVNRNYTLGDVLNYTNYVIPEIPVFSVYAKNSCLRDFVAAQKNEVYQLVDATTVRRIHRCHNCGRYEKDTEEFKKCSRCKCTYYCSRECQIADWKVHKHSCQ